MRLGEIGVVVVAYESAGALPALLASLERHEGRASVVVVDNASPSGPPTVGARNLVGLDSNRGYGSACNAGAKWLLDENPAPQYLAFLNPDVQLLGPSLTELAASFDARPGTGVATGPMVDSYGRRIPSAWGQPSALRAFWAATGWQLPRARRILGRVLRGGVFTSGTSMGTDDLLVDGFVIGGAMMVRQKCWTQLQGFDEDFFMFGEDVDLCHRARMAGWEVRVLPSTPLVHERGGSSAGVTEAMRWQWYVEGARRFARKHLTVRRQRRIERALRVGRRVRRSPAEHA